MKRISCLLVACLLLPLLPASAQPSLHHTTGLIDMAITDFGSLSSGLVANSLLGNCWYPLGTDQASPYLNGFSEIWCGDANGHVASALDLAEDGTPRLGEWQSVEAPIYYTDGRHTQTILTRYQIAPEAHFPFELSVAQLSYTWNLSEYPDAGGIVVLQFVVANPGSLDIEELYLALAADWQLDLSDMNAQNGNADLFEWFPLGQAGVAFDAQPEDGITPVQAAVVLIDGPFRAHRIIDMAAWDYSDTARSEVMAPPEFTVDNSAVLPGPGDYMDVLSVGPMNVPAGERKIITYALVLAPDQNALINAINLAHRLALAPSNLQITTGDRHIHLEWTDAIAQRTYGVQVFRATSPDGTFDPIGRGVFQQSSFDDQEVQNGQTYDYQLLALDANGQPVVAMNQPVVSDLVQATPNPVPASPTGLQYLITHQGVELRWDASSDAVHYRVQRRDSDEAPWTTIGEVADERFVDAEIAPGYTYSYAVVAVNTFGQSSEPGQAVQVALSAPEPAEDLTTLDQIEVYPNPLSLQSGKRITFRGLPPNARIVLYDLAGDTIRILEHEDGTQKETWNARNKSGGGVRPGMYVYHVTAILPGRDEVTTKGLLSILP